MISEPGKHNGLAASTVNMSFVVAVAAVSCSYYDRRWLKCPSSLFSMTLTGLVVADPRTRRPGPMDIPPATSFLASVHTVQ